MKVCPNCKRHCADEAKYCVACKTNIEKQPIVKESKLGKKVNKGIGCLIIVIIALVIVFLLMLIPGSILNPDSNQDFGAGITPFFARGWFSSEAERSITHNAFFDVELPPRA
ncbi:hypothetical protein LJC56_01225 [Christensenellaceae bacterium OttesenSCG-928-K19]|nr:hypothetical protein [Christensenellaceae bacterium OttesenSCG-928-K19]